MWEIPFSELILLGANIPKTSESEEDKKKEAPPVTGADLFKRFNNKS